MKARSALNQGVFTQNRRKRNYDKTFEAVIAAELNFLFHLSSIASHVMRVSIAVFEAPEKTVKLRLRRSFTHVSADATWFARGLGIPDRFSIQK